MTSARKWAVIAVAVLMTAIVGGIVLPSMVLWSPLWLKDFGAGPAAVMAANTFNQIGSAVVAPFVGYAVGRVSVRNLMLLGLVITVVALVGIACATHMWQITALYTFFLSASFVLCGPTLCQALAVRLLKQNGGLGIGMVTAGMCLSTITIPPLIGALLEYGYNWRTVEFVMVGIVFALVPLVFFVVREPEDGIDLAKTHDGAEVLQLPTVTLREVLTNQAFLATMLAIIPLFILFNALYYTLGLRLAVMGATPAQASMIVSVAGLVATVGVVGFGVLADRTSQWMLLMLAIVILTVAFLTFAYANGYYLILILVCVMDFTIGGISTLGPAIFAKQFGQANFARANGLSRPFFVISSFSPLVAGYLYQGLGDYSKVYMVLMICLPVSYVGLIWLRYSGTRRAPLSPDSIQRTLA
jgi:MFS family permease